MSTLFDLLNAREFDEPASSQVRADNALRKVALKANATGNAGALGDTLWLLANAAKYGPFGSPGMNVPSYRDFPGTTDNIALRTGQDPDSAEFVMSSSASFGPPVKAVSALAKALGDAGLAMTLFQGSPHRFKAETLARLPDGTQRWFEEGEDIPQGAEVIKEAPLGRVRMDKIGTGEGAQAYGHGLYFGESKETGEWYRKNLTDATLELDGVAIDPRNLSVDALRQQFGLSQREALGVKNLSKSYYSVPGATWGKLEDKASELDESIAMYRSFPDSELDAAGVQEKQQMLEYLESQKEALEKFGGRLKPAEGNLYTVDIPDEAIDRMLDWDKPLSEQPEVIKALKTSKSQIVRDTLSQMESSGFEYSGDLGPMTGETLNRMLSINFEGRRNSKKASEAFRKAGIPGIKYLDGTSRSAGEGTRNFVVFDEDLVTVLKRNDEPVSALARELKK